MSMYSLVKRFYKLYPQNSFLHQTISGRSVVKLFFLKKSQLLLKMVKFQSFDSRFSESYFNKSYEFCGCFCITV